MELLEFYRTGYNMTECPEIVAYGDYWFVTLTSYQVYQYINFLSLDELRSAASNIVNRDSFGLVVNELIRRGEVSLGHSRDGERVLKFKVCAISIHPFCSALGQQYYGSSEIHWNGCQRSWTQTHDESFRPWN